MVVSLKSHHATEKRAVEWCIEHYCERKQHVEKVIARIKGRFDLKYGAKILEIGAAQGLSVIVFKQLGYDCIGLEPSFEAIAASKELSTMLQTDIDMKHGFAEDLPFEDGTFDAVVADSVIEHVRDVERV